MSFSSLYILEILYLNELILFIDLKSEDRIFHIFGPVGQAFQCPETSRRRMLAVNQRINSIPEIKFLAFLYEQQS